MGALVYGGSEDRIEIDDRALAHLKVVVMTKLRRGESFLVSWKHSGSAGRSSVWVEPSIPLRFVFDDVEPTSLNPRWLQQLAETAGMTGTIRLIPEDDSSALTIPDAASVADSDG